MSADDPALPPDSPAPAAPGGGDAVGNLTPARVTVEKGDSGGKSRLPHTVLAIGTLGVLVTLALRNFDFAKVRDALVASASHWPLVAAAAVLALTICMFACSVRLWLLTRPLPLPSGGRHISLGEMTSVYIASSAAHHLLPAPAAEVLRTVYLRRRWGYSIAALVASQLVDRVVDALGLGLEIGVIALFAARGLPPALHASLGLFAAGTIGGTVAVVLVAARHGARHHRPGAAPVDVRERGRLRAFLHTLGEGVYLLRHPRTWAASLVCSIVNDLANVATLMLAAAAVDVTLTPAAAFVGVLAARFAGLLPSTPGQFGVVEAGLVLVLAGFGVDRNRALAVAVLYHLAHFAPITLVGLFELRRHWGPRRETTIHTSTQTAAPAAPATATATEGEPT